MNMKKLIESMDRIEECGMTEMPAMPASLPAPEMDKGNPVTVSVSMNASGKEHVADLLDMMKNAGLGGAAPAADKMMSPRMDMERLSGIMNGPMDEPEMEEVEDEIEVEGDYANEPDAQYGDMSDAIPDGNDLNRKKKSYAATQPGDNPMAVEGVPDLSPKFIKHLQVTFGDKEMLSGSETRKVEDMINKLSIENIKTLVSADIPHVSDMAKEYMRNKTPGGMKNYGEDMVEAIKAQLMKALTEKKAKPDFLDVDKDGNKKEPMKKAVKDAGKGAGSKPKKGQVPPQFKK